MQRPLTYPLRMNRNRRNIAAVLVGAAALIYGVSPIDIIPDFLGPLGLTDDLAGFVGAGLAIWRLLKGRDPKTPPAV